ncbi:hypothetical protein BX666DRAFT_376547 [Dichotomocladium elegans]|nr:hypothetical protein BX666DRAFT_376547 [Dichotomocladium elegans]
MQQEKPVRPKVVRIPKSALLSTQSSAFANILHDEQVDGACSLAMALLYEIFQGADSPWFGYLQTLSIPEDLPIFWSDEERLLLEGTELDSVVANEYYDLMDDYNMVVVPMFQKYPYIFQYGLISFDHFCKVMAIVTSRAFPVDRFHKDALIPFADMFNHRGGGRDESVRIMIDYDVCRACGRPCCDKHHGEENDKVEKKDGNGCGIGHGALEDLEALEDAGVNFWVTAAPGEVTARAVNDDTCDVILDRDVVPGQELLAAYGSLSNFALLNKFGFCYDGNKNDYISVNNETVFSVCVEIIRDEVHGKRKLTDDATFKANERVQDRFDFYLSSIQHVLFPHTVNLPHAYYTDVHGRYDKPLLTLLWIVFVNDHLFTTQLKSDTSKAIECLDQLDNFTNQERAGEKRARNTVNALQKTEKLVYMACRMLSEYRQREYLDEQRQWISAEEERLIRNQVVNKRAYYAITCRISEKEIIQKSIQYYTRLIQLSVEDAELLSIGKQHKPIR